MTSESHRATLGAADAHVPRSEEALVISRSRRIAAPEDVLPLLRAARQRGERAFYWEQPAREHAIVAIGSVWHAEARGATRFAALTAACRALREHCVASGDGDPLLLGSFAFSPDDPMRGDWQGFANARVDLPRLCVVRRGTEATVTVNHPSSAGAAIDPRIDLDHPLRAAAVTPARYHAYASPAPATWKAAVGATVDDIRRGAFDKLVLARTCHVESDRNFDALAILGELRHRYPTCTIFSTDNGEAAFLGATPETLLESHAGELYVAALAGTSGRASTPGEDRRLGIDLTRSDKNAKEHAIVVRALRTELEALCSEVSVDEKPRLLALENVHHLRTAMRGRLRHPLHLLEIAARLHPSPAVGGFPRDAALTALAAREGFARGLYTGALGWMNLRGEGEIDVALRCAVVRGGHAALFAGAGIVADSDPQAELCETRLKLQPVLSALMEL